MSSEAVGELFEPIVAQILVLIDDQMTKLRNQGKRISGIVLVGGFGQSNCLFRVLQDRYANAAPPPPYPGTEKGRTESAPRFEVMQPNNAWTAVVRGAVLRGLEGQDLVLSRKARRHYGVSHRADFDPKIHLKSERVWDGDEEKWMVDDRVKWYIRKGRTCKADDPVLFPFYNTFRDGMGKTQVSNLVVCDDDDPPDIYDPSDSGPVRELCKLPVNLDSVPGRLWKTETNSKGQRYEKLDYHLGMQIDSGGLRFDQRVDGVVYGDVVAEFK